MANSGITLIGTVHWDLDGKYRLDTLLDRLSPAIIGLEYSKDRDDLSTVQRTGADEAKSLEDFVLKSGLNLTDFRKKTLLESSQALNKAHGFEVTCTRAYSLRTGAGLEYIDMSVFKNGKERFEEGYEQLFSASSLKVSANPRLRKLVEDSLDLGTERYLDGFRRQVDLTYRAGAFMSWLYRLMMSSGLFEYQSRILTPEAREAMQQIFSPARDEHMASRIREIYEPGKPLAAVMGLGHLSGVRRKIHDLNPRTLYLLDYQKA